jgi:hypothetical protein
MIAALITFIVAVFATPPRFNLVALGLAFWAAAVLIDSVDINAS